MSASIHSLATVSSVNVAESNMWKKYVQKPSCNIKLSTKRHPKACKYFSAHQICKFGVVCSYKYVTTSNNSEIPQLAAKVVLLEGSIRFLKATIDELTVPKRHMNMRHKTQSQIEGRGLVQSLTQLFMLYFTLVTKEFKKYQNK